MDNAERSQCKIPIHQGPLANGYLYSSSMAKSAMSLRVQESSWVMAGVSRHTGVRRAAGVLVLGAMAVVAGVVAVKSTQLAVGLIAVVLLGLYVGYAKSHLRGAIIVMFASLALIPVYAVPTFRSFSPEPTAVAAVVVALVCVRLGGPWRLTGVDLTFAATCGAMILAALLGPHSLTTTLSELFLWVPPYMAGRAVCRRPGGAQTFVFAAAIAGLIALPFIAYETVTRHNIFFPLARSGTELTRLWAKPAFRPGGLLRSEGAFGHPLSMALIVGSCAVFAFALAIQARGSRRKTFWLLVAVALVVGQYVSYERSGWIVIIGGLLLFGASAVPGGKRVRYAMVVVVIAVPLAFLAISATHPRNGEASVARAESTADRVDLWRHALEPGVFGIVGLPETVSFNHFVNAVRPGRTAIDSGYLFIGDVYGLIAFIALFAVVAAVIRVMVIVRGTWVAVIPAVALAELAALTVIAFQTQVPIFVWLVVGAVSGVDIRRRAANSELPLGRVIQLPEVSSVRDRAIAYEAGA
jgi:hypothetical protein